MTVYFIGGDFDRVKIGYTEFETPTSRLSGLQCGSPLSLRVLAYCPGTSEDERSLHNAFVKENTHGEWFTITPRLAALIAYVEKYKTLESWRMALDQPERLADFVASFGSPRGFNELALKQAPLSAIAWSHLKGEPRELEDPPEWPEMIYDWNFVVHGLAIGVKHAFVERWGPGLECYWLRVCDGQPMRFNAAKGIEITAAYLADTNSADESAAIWIQACVRDYLGRDRNGESVRLRRLLPGYASLVSAARGVVAADWPSMCTDTLPVPLTLPAHAVLSPEEFVRLCAVHYLATAARYTIRANWADGVHCRWPREPESEAA